MGSAGTLHIPKYLVLHRDLRVVACSHHGSSYIKSSLDRHLQIHHDMPLCDRTLLIESLLSSGLASSIDQVHRPQDGGSHVEGLPIYIGFRCDAASDVQCRYLTRDKTMIEKHCRAKHKIRTGKRGRPGAVDTQASKGYVGVRLQTLFSEKKQVDYFVVDAVLGKQTLTSKPQQSSNDEANIVERTVTMEASSAATLRESFTLAQTRRIKQYDVIEGLAHVTELTPWQQRTRFHAHLVGLNVEELELSYRKPKKGEELALGAICESAERILRKSMAMLNYNDSDERQLSTLNEQLLNTFRRVETSQDPIKPLQNESSRKKYIHTWQSLLCYYLRVDAGEHLTEKQMFKATPEQQSAWSEVRGAADELLAEDEETGSDGTSSDEETDEDVLDEAVLKFCIALIRQRLDGRSFDSPMISFAAVIAWEPKRKTWMQPGDYTSYLSQLVYDCQMMVLQYCVNVNEQHELNNLSECIVGFRDQWLLSDTPGPMGVISNIRLIGFGIGRTEVQQAKVRWSADGETIVHHNIQLEMSTIRDLVNVELQTAEEVFRRDLCLGADVGKCPLVFEIRDNWDQRSPGASFLTDVRNATSFEQCTSRLFNQVVGTPALARLFLEQDSSGSWRVRKDAVDQYEATVRNFLEHLMVLVHVGSGQPARRPEFLSMKWCNRQADIRNIFIHDGYVVFILKYHKSQAQLNASRFPVRVMLPAVGKLLVGYLLVVLPFRVWLASMKDPDIRISEYLWADLKGVWPEDRVTKAFRSVTKRAIGVPLDIRSWRQIAVGIAIKKFAGAKVQVEAGDDSDGNECVEEREEGVPEAMHWQASHTPRVGNRAYGGTVNFRTGLTDAGLQEYVRISEMWHDFLAGKGSKRVGIKRERSVSADVKHLPLPKRMAMRGVKLECRRHWSMQEARVALQHMYGTDATYRSAKQEEAVRAVVSGVSPVVAVLGTGEGKSLLYMLQQRLPGAGTTVLVVPLVALKQDTVRRCKQLGIECTVWNEGFADGIGNSLLLVSADEAVGVGFQSHLHMLDVAGQLGSIVLDESHLVVTATSYREKLERTRELRKVRCQFIYLTATLPVCMQSLFMERLLLQKSMVIRSASVRRDMIYEVIRSGSRGKLVSTAIENIRPVLELDWFRDEAGARAIVYCRTKANADEIAVGLGCDAYYSDCGSKEEKRVMAERWMKGEKRVITATSAFGAGVDYSSVRAVFHIGEPDSAINFSQEIGRGGRDGKGCISQVFVEEGWRAKTRDREGELLTEDSRTMQEYLDEPRCRVAVLGRFLDGVGKRCAGEQFGCDRCEGWEESRAGDVGKDEEEEGDEEVEEMGRIGEEGWEGAKAIVEGERGDEERKERFLSNVELLRGLCMICVMEDGEKWKGHGLEECKSVDKWRFFSAKKAAMRKGGWIEAYSGCFRCGMGQGICDRVVGGECRYRDVLMPLSWRVFGWWEGRGRVVVREFGMEMGEEEWMERMGRGISIFGGKGTGMMGVCEGVVEWICRERM